MPWRQLIDIQNEVNSVQWRQALEELEAQNCPQCGEPLTANEGGEIRCRFDGWEPSN